MRRAGDREAVEMNMASVGALQNQPSIFRRLADTLIKPTATMAALSTVRRSRWAIPALLVVASIIGSVVAYSHADCQYVHRLEMDHYTNSPQQGGRPPEPPTPLPVTMAIRVGGRVVSTVVAWLAWSGMLYLGLVLLGQTGVGFGSVWTLVLWTWLPHAVRGIVQSVAMALVHRPIYNQGLSGLVVDNTPPPPMTFHHVIPTTNQLALASLLSRVDVYLVWQLVLIVMGTTALTRLSRRRAMAVILGIWLALTLISLVPTLFPGTFARFRYF
jgi:hypothetical protein